MPSIRNKRSTYLGFNDLGFMLIGSIILSFITDFLFTGCSFIQLPFLPALANWSISYAFAITNWLIMRELMIWLRKRMPEFKDSIKRISILFIIVVVIVVAIDRLGSYILGLAFGENYNHPSSTKLLVPVLLISIMTIAIYEAIYYYIQLKKSVQDEEQSKRVIIESQFDALRNQARPHFLFNSLNTLRDVIENDPKNEAIQFVDKLADVYRYILESGDANLIPLKDELKFAQSYMHIQAERFGDKLHLSWNINEEKLNKLVLPMSLQLLLENAIKHNVISHAKPLSINVFIEADHLVVENNLQVKSTQTPSTKIGLNSLQKRYELISNKALIIEDKGTKFIVKIPLLNPAH